MKQVFAMLGLAFWGHGALADHIPNVAQPSATEAYQLDAAKKRYADILTIAGKLEAFVDRSGQMPVLNPSVPANGPDAQIYEVAILAQPEAVEHIFRYGTPFGFSLAKFRPQVLLNTMADVLGSPLTLPIDPQRVGVNFAPGYFVFLRRATADMPAHFIVLATFAQPVARSTQVAPNVHIMAIGSHDVPFIVPVQPLSSFDTSLVNHAMAQGHEADAVFRNYVATSITDR